MACPVYCLVQHPDQLGPLVERLRAAGVQMDRILVVQRGGESGGEEGECPPSTPCAGACRLLHTLWQLPLAPAVWWWPLAVGELCAAQQARSDASVEREIISLAAYKRKRRAGAER